MELTRAIAISVIAASLGLGAAVEAQSLKNVDTPSEFPPASYQGRQYVDSKGCVYIRAGVDGATTWVPRMTRSRKVVCGFKPTVVNAAPGATAAPRLDKNVVVIQPAAPPGGSATVATAARPAPKPTAAKPRVAQPVVIRPAAQPAAARPPATPPAKPPAAKPQPAPKPVATARAASPKAGTTTLWDWSTTPSGRQSATPATAATAAPKPKPAAASPRRTLDPTPRRSGVASPCREGLARTSKHVVRCGPQSELPYTPGTGNPTAPPPRIIYQRQGGLSGPASPAPGTIVRQGEIASTVRVVPRHVYEARLLANDDAAVPEGYRRVFDDGRLNPHRAEQTFAGKAAMDAIWGEKLPRKLKPATAAPGALSVVSTRSAPAEKALRIGGQNYVQVQTYRDPAAAQAAAQSLRAGGMPVRIGKYSRDGQVYRMVLVGPYDGAGRAAAVAEQLRRGGYGDAFLRR
ncbi:SPOR domain-containing protein [Shimia sp.]|uniref:SPOR domain-containing protein n=1 Tax=Shimia sp. TaxID=1954381 RepID=UPI003562B767